MGGSQGQETPMRALSPDSNWTLRASRSGLDGLMIVNTLAVSRFVMFSVDGWQYFGSPRIEAIYSSPSEEKK